LGAVLVALPNGIQFAVGSGFTDAQRAHPPANGSTITFRYQELTNGGVPRFPTFVRVRQEESAQANRLF
jgi:DNA ligase-1